MFTRFVAAAVAATCLLSTNAFAAYTGIGRPAKGELSHRDIFSSTYGGKFRYSGASLTNGTITATRVSDAVDSSLFDTGAWSSKAVASFGAARSSFGVVGENGKFQRLFTTAGSKAQVAGASARTASGDFALRNFRGRGTFSTNDLHNAGKTDQAITYKLSGLDFGGDVYVVFFENRALGRSDRDFNDLVVELSAAHAPSPAAAALGLAMLAAMASVRRR